MTLNEISHYKSLIKQDTENRKLIKKLQLDKEELKKQLRINGVSNWVACKDSLPLTVGFYAVYKPTQPYVLGLYFDSDQNFRYNQQVVKRITHWQKLPKPPCF